MSELGPAACADCLRRSWLLAQLAPYIEKIATGAPGSRSPELLRLSSQDLAAVAAPQAADRLLEGVEEIPESRLHAGGQTTLHLVEILEHA